MIIERGKILSVANKIARVQLKDKSIHDFLLYMPIGTAYNPPANSNCFVVGESIDTAIVFVYLPSKQPVLATNEVAIGNFSNTNKITFKANGDIEVAGANLNALFSGDVSIDGANIKLGDGTNNVLTQGASMQVTITVGNSAGTYPVVINSAGQNKVKA